MRIVVCWTRAAIVAATSLLAVRVPAQDLAKRVTASDGTVNVIYPSRPSACGDGRSFQNVLGDNRFYSGDVVWTGRDDARTRMCVHGPARAMATVLDGEVTRLRLYIGPIPATPADIRTITVSPAEAVGWLSTMASRGTSRVAGEAILALVAADAPDPWPFLLRLARDDDRPRNVRGSALMWLSYAVNDHLGIADADSRASDDDEMRKEAVFVLSQRPKNESVPELIDLARTARNPAARKAAIFWLGQTGDRRAADVYAELLGIR